MPTPSLDTLDRGDIHQRADVGRQLSKVGVPEQIPRLLRAASEDPSPGVRLYAINAVADILSRYRVGPAAEKLDAATRRGFLEQLRKIDPAANAGVFSVYACLGLPEQLRPLFVGLRDPRLDVRTGASVGLYRYAISAAVPAESDLVHEVTELLVDPRVRPDTRANLVRLCATCGWHQAAPVLEGFLDREDQVAQAAEQALALLQQLNTSHTLFGVWWSDGRDAGQIDSGDPDRDYLFIDDSVAVVVRSGSVKLLRCEVDGATRLAMEGEPDWSVRRMVLPPPGTDERGLALRIGLETWYRGAPADIVETAAALADRWKSLSADPQLIERCVDALLAALPESPAGARAAARLELQIGRTDKGLARLEELARGKRPVAEVFFFLGEARALNGDAEGAAEAYRGFLERGPKRSPLATLARQRIGEES